jgi:hypothetical protein
MDSASLKRRMVFNTILALYAGEDEEEALAELDHLFEKCPKEIEFYIP